jgi:hypothetical protein
MKNAAAFRASFADWKLLKTRGIIQVVFEVPLHEADEAYQALGGMPDPAKERWFGIAALDEKRLEVYRPSREAEAAPETSRSPLLPAPASRLARRAGILCNHPVFWRFLEQEQRLSGFTNATVTSSETAAGIVRTICGIASRRELIPGTPEGDEWEKLYGRFIAWRDVPELAPTDHQSDRVDGREFPAAERQE